MSIFEIFSVASGALACVGLTAYAIRSGIVIGELKNQIKTLEAKAAKSDERLENLEAAKAEAAAALKLVEQAQNFVKETMARIETELRRGMDEVREVLGLVQASVQGLREELRKK